MEFDADLNKFLTDSINLLQLDLVVFGYSLLVLITITSSYKRKMKILKYKNVLTCTLLLLSSLTASAFEISPALANQAWAWYKGALKTNPLLTKSVTSSGIMTISDAICQQLTKEVEEESKDPAKKPNIDYRRMLEVAFTGLTWSGPISHFWYGTLEKIVKIQDPILGLFARIILDAIIFSPVTITGYFTWRSILEGSGVDGMKTKLERKRFVTTVLGAWKFWPLANIINFSMVPVAYRVLYSNVLSLFWTGYLTFVNAKAKRTLDNSS